MQVFNVIVRLAGEIKNEVNKRGVTVPEILVLRKIHGNDGVVNIKNVGYDSTLDHDDERERLAYIYTDGLAALHETEKTSIEKMFSSHGDLPTELRNFEGELVDEDGYLEDFQKPLPFQSANYEGRGAKKKARPPKGVDKTPVKGAKKSNLENVL